MSHPLAKQYHPCEVEKLSMSVTFANVSWGTAGDNTTDHTYIHQNILRERGDGGVGVKKNNVWRDRRDKQSTRNPKQRDTIRAQSNVTHSYINKINIDKTTRQMHFGQARTGQHHETPPV
jgi:hypothetical protein